jgi:SAM-dependent methyltransferase
MHLSTRNLPQGVFQYWGDVEQSRFQSSVGHVAGRLRVGDGWVDIEALANSKIGKLIVKVAGAAMESRLRYRFSGPMKILRYLVAMDVLSDYVEQTSKKVQAAALQNVHVLKRDALDTGLDAESIDTVLLFSVIPSPTAPLNRLLPEMHRVLKPEGTLAVTTFPWVLRSIRRSGLFTYVSKRNGVSNFRRS